MTHVVKTLELKAKDFSQFLASQDYKKNQLSKAVLSQPNMYFNSFIGVYMKYIHYKENPASKAQGT